jgi:hypothetical protein
MPKILVRNGPNLNFLGLGAVASLATARSAPRPLRAKRSLTT